MLEYITNGQIDLSKVPSQYIQPGSQLSSGQAALSSAGWDALMNELQTKGISINDAFSIGYALTGLSDSQLRERPGAFGDWSNVAKNFGSYQNFAQFLAQGGKLSGTDQAVPNNPNDVKQILGSQAPQGQFIGTDDNGKPIYPQTQVLGDNSGGSLGSQAPSVATASSGYTKDAQGHVFDSQGNHVDYASLPKGADGYPIMNLVTLPVGQYSMDASGKVLGGSSGTGGSTSGSGGLTQDMVDGLKFLGWSDQQISSASAADAKQWALVGEYMKKQTDLGAAVGQANAKSLQDAYNAALKDPNIMAKYGDMQKNDVNNFNANLQALQTNTDVNSQNQQIAFNQQQKDLANAHAAAGTAYSGFRAKAEQDLGTQQSGIVKSSLANLKSTLSSQLNPLESFYGSSQFSSLFPNQGINFTDPQTGQTQNVGYNSVGNLVGTEAAQKATDVTNRQQQIYGNLAAPTA